ncbi:AbrB/MazE/SpoVT family DNA-binding domain-containing protein [Synergistaceae bacterium OttesenSCG-928-I11]|nr:AbrB/MazE/SpoVT family DNA-binding domain-containing protein [Synergistaceae bacterium OttesenSCG-928-I11]
MGNDMTKMTSKGQTTVPMFVRRKMGFEAGDYLLWEMRGDIVTVRKPKDLMDYVGFLGSVNFPDDEEGLLTPEFGRKMQEREG